MSTLVQGVRDDQLGDPTPCPGYTVGDLLDHIGGLTVAFTHAARKTPLDQAGSGDASRLEEGWRDRISADLKTLAEAWRDPEAWTGMTAAGGVDLPGEVGGTVALDELAVHGWDLARGTGQRFELDEASLLGAQAFLDTFSGPGSEDERGDAFGPVVPVDDDAPLLDRVVGLSGRDPKWCAGFDTPNVT